MKVLLVLLTLDCTCLAMTITANMILSQDITLAKSPCILQNSKIFKFLYDKLPNCPTESSNEEYNIIANPNDCESYFVCREGYPILQKCPNGQRFDKEKLKCRNAIEVECNIPNPGGSTTTDPISTTIESITTITTSTEPTTVSTSDPVTITRTEESITTTEIITDPTTTITTNEPITTTTTEKPIITTTTEESISKTTTEESIITTTTEDPIATTTTEEPIATVTTENPISTTPTEKPITDTTIEESISTTTITANFTSATTVVTPIPLDCATAYCGQFLSNINDCTTYYHCVGSIPILTICPSGLKWNSKNCTCDYKCVL